MKKALIVRGGWEGHQPEAATDLFLPHLSKTFDVQVENSPAVYAEAPDVDLIVQCLSAGTIEPEELAGLSAAVKAGTGFAGWHGGIVDSFRESFEYLHLTGGQFAGHPPDGDTVHIPHRVEFVKDHEITRGLADFDLVTEQYWVLTDAYDEVLATTTHAPRDAWNRPVTVPAIWTRQWGAGRVFVATPGHDLDVLRHPTVRTVIERGLSWASR